MSKKYKDWVPEPESQFNLWQGNFITQLQDPAINTIANIPPAKMTVLLDLQADYEAAFAVCPPHTFGGKSLNTARRDAKKAYISGEGGIRKIAAQYLRHNEELSVLQRVEIGLTLIKNTRTLVTPGSEPDVPLISAKSNSVGTVTFTFSEGGNTKSRAIPADMHHCMVQYIITAANAEPPSGEDACNKHVEMQKSPYTIDVKRQNAGNRLWGFAAWVDTRGVIRNWSAVFSCIIT